MRKGVLSFAALTALLSCRLAAQDVVVRAVDEVSMPASPDSNSPAFWRDGQLFWYGSHGSPWLSSGPNQFGPWDTRSAAVPSPDNSPKWMEAVWPDSNGVVWGWYHAEPVNLFPDSTLTAPKVGAAVSFDGGYTMNDLGFVLASGDAPDPSSQNGFFAGGHGDPSTLLDREHKYFYIFFGNYGGAVESQGVSVARMAFEDRANPKGKVWKYFNGTWQEPGLGGRVTPIFPVRRSWMTADPDAFWGPSVHWNRYLNCYVMLLNHASGTPSFGQEGVYVSFNPDLSRPELWTQPRKILGRPDITDPGQYYPQVMGLGSADTDRSSGQTARLYLAGVSKWEIDFVPPQTAPTAVQVIATPSPAAVASGGSVTFSVTAMGLPAFTYQWFKDGIAVAGATASTYQVPSATVLDAGAYSVVVANSLGTATSSTVTLSVTPPVAVVTPPVNPAPSPPAPESFLSNLSVRSVLAAEAPQLIVGFTVRGTGPKPLVVRAIGPSLALFGLMDGVVDPRLEIYDAGSVRIAENDDWLSSDAAAFAAVGAFALPVGSSDAGLVVPISPGAGTAVITGAGGGSVLAEIYDPAAAANSKIVNLSARALVGPGSQVLIAGFGVTGSGTKRLLVRALGPELAALGLNDALADPALEVYDGAGNKIAANNDWDAALASSFADAGALALTPGSRDAAVVVTVAAGGSYSVVVRSNDGATGEALLDIYELP